MMSIFATRPAFSSLCFYGSILALGVFLLVPPAVLRDLWLYMEARRAIIALEMAQRGEWAIPHDLGDPVFTKPPLFYWLAGAVFRLTGSRAEWIARLPSLLTALLVPLAMARMTSLRWGRRAGAVSGSVLLVLPLYHWMGHMAELDMLFIGTSALAAVAFWEVAAGTALAPFAGPAGFLLLGLSFISKGPLAPLAVLLALGVWMALMRPVGFLRRLHPIAGLALLLLPGSLWLLALAPHGIGPARVLSDIRLHVGEDAPHSGDPAFYLALLRNLMFPWLYIWLAAALLALASAFRARTLQSLPRRVRDALLSGRGEILYLGLWFVITLAFLSAIGSKRSYYAVALTPPIAGLTGALFAHLPGGRLRWTARSRQGYGLGIAVFALLALSLGVAATRTPVHLEPMDGENEPRDRLLLLLIALWSAGFAMLLIRSLRLPLRRPLLRPIFVLTIFVMAVYTSFFNFVVYPALNATHSQKRAAKEIAGLLPPDATVFSLFNCHDLWFYWGITDPLHFESRGGVRRYVQNHPEAWGIAFARDFKALETEGDWRVFYRGNYLDAPKRRLILFRAAPAQDPAGPPSSRELSP